jgi:hypothetical protein
MATRKKLQTVLQNKYGGGTVRDRVSPLTRVPHAGLKRIAERFAFGDEKYGEDNWKGMLDDPEGAAAFAKDANDHLVDHAFKMAQGLEPDADHVGAIGWAAVVLATIEDTFGCPWTEL